MTLAALTSLLLVLAPEEPDELEALQTVVQAALRKAGPSVVRIETVGGIRKAKLPGNPRKKMTVPERPGEEDRRPNRDPLPKEKEGRPEGRTPRFKNEFDKLLALPGFKKAEGPTTGVILSSDGYIVTSAWNFDRKPSVVSVTTADGKTYAATLLGRDRGAGLALLKIDATGLPTTTFLDPKDVKVGSWALALGRSITRKGVAVKYGIISAKNRIMGKALQTDAATSPTNYGGPLIDVEGRVFGIIVPLGSRGNEANPNWYDSGIGFAVPIPDPKALIEKLKSPSVVLEPAFLGVAMDQDSTAAGAKITSVVKGTGAEKAGLKKGDVVIEVDGEKVVNAFTLRFAIGRKRAGDKIAIKVQRGKETIDIEAVLGKRPAPTRDKSKLPEIPRGPGKQPDKDK